VAQETHDQRGADRTFLAGAPDAVDDGLEGHAACGMGLRIEEDLGVPHVVGGGPGEIGRGHVIEVLFGEQDTRAGVINIEEGLQIAESVGLAQRLDRGIRQRYAVPLRQRKDQFGLQRALDMDVQLSFRHLLKGGAQLLGQHDFLRLKAVW